MGLFIFYLNEPLFMGSDPFPLSTPFFSPFVYVFRKILNIDATFCFL
ncbi:hypothetical protein AD44_3913 [Escherichia coli 3-373-03_S4_C3]|nr:hypothetical protein ECLT68_0869 [Escherichia coli LT-68]KDU28700.1 hypothetical protein AD17_4139 [Escherichia coli 3-373-03_S4_C2]KDU50591.1 hypothetical protein AC89_3987 [Escherichia coli 3-373-03_S4_C1]KEK91396.1 hypothetical protein AB49_4258 [Escherichia coli 4-203-08_S1_C2]KEK93984.1 hypothetical protein AB78_4299 [Escherichia coli 4-203-08_S1_C3]KEL22528.1 hypothetical protein AD44_3913 [Escherichia coli 3-373-03_S4_C3]